MTICLSMIVKNEAPVIRRCLESVRPVIDSWCIVDTGSTDGTQDIIREVMGDLPGVLHESPWVDFAHNRSEALAWARPMADYSFIIDADDVLANYERRPLTADCYSVAIVNQGVTYSRVQVVSNRLPWSYKGVVHEFLDCRVPYQAAEDLQWCIVVGTGSARGRDPETYRQDASILLAAFNVETDPWLKARYGFYLAQSYRDCGMQSHALEMYEWRAKHEFWIEEVYISLLNAARLRETLAPETAAAAYAEAINAVKTRAEAFHGLARFRRLAGDYESAYHYAKLGTDLAMPNDGLFVERWIYDWGIMDELAISAYWSGRYRLSLDACELILAEGKCPDTGRIRTNANFARRKLVTT